ncbi:MAG: CopG family transcriptional regulator [Pseudomonadota bacterium]
MHKEINYEENPFGNVKVGKRILLPDLPSPAELAKAEKTTKITLSISSDSLNFFKKEAAKYNVPYQAMIRRLLDEYRSKI